MSKELEKSLSVLPVMESFDTIQGEGFHQGRAAHFIRLGGCDVGCVWCDVKESWDASAHPSHTVSEIVDMASNGMSRLAIVTGGEPLMHDLNELTLNLKVAGFETNIETSGAHPITGDWDWVCFSPKKFKAPLPEIYGVANELKIIIYNKSDFVWAESFASKVSGRCRLYLQPEWSVREKVTPMIIDYILKNPNWEISLQIHKFMDIP